MQLLPAYSTSPAPHTIQQSKLSQQAALGTFRLDRGVFNGWQDEGHSISQYFFSKNPKCWFFLFPYTNVFLCAKFGDVKPRIDEKQHPQIWTCFWARCRNKIPRGNCDFLSTKCFININLSSWSTDCAAENSKPRVMCQDQRGVQPSKNWENLDFSSHSARVLGFSSQSHTIWS